MKNLSVIRKELHKIAELSGMEAETSNKVAGILKNTGADRIDLEIAGHGVMALYKGKSPSMTIMLRADLDALPITETNDFNYIGDTPGVSHKCGHDGHMTILLGLARGLKEYIKDLPCNVVLLFQPAEETAEGAVEVIKDDNFIEYRPDFIFGLHNLPGFPLHSIIIKNDTFASASIGMIAEFKGMTSHAGHPENGTSPVLAMTNLIHGLMSLPSQYTKLENAANITIIHAKLGEVAFGTSPGDAVVMATLRAHLNEDMDKLIEQAALLVEGLAKTYDLEYKISWREKFPATVNDPEGVEIIKKASGLVNLQVMEMKDAFPWSEDFGWYAQKYRCAFFGLGSGLDHPQLHNSNYDFPDEIIDTGVKIFKRIITETVQ